MKKILILINSLILLFSGSIAAQTSNLVVFSEDAAPFYLMLNGIRQNAAPQTNIKITGISSPSNALLIIFEDNSLGTLKKNIYFSEMDVEVTTKITRTKKGLKLKYFGAQPINPSASNSGYYTTTYQTTDAQVQPAQPVEIVKPVEPVQPVTEPVVTEPVQPVTETPVKQPVQENTNIKQPTLETSPTKEPANSNSVNMLYNWTAGQSYRFSVVQNDDVSTSMMGMNMKDRFTTNTEFEMLISSVSNGKASGVLYLNNFNITDSKGTVLATLNNLPAHALRSDFTVDSKGNFVFPKRISLVTTEQGNILVYGNADANSVQAGAQTGEIKLDAYAEFDPKSGKLKMGYTLKENQPTKQVSVKMDENTDFVDVLPYDYLSMLALPEGAVAQGDKAQVVSGIYTMDILAKSISNGTAQMNYKMSSDKSKNITDAKADVKTENSDLKMDMPLMNMMELDADDKAAMNMSKAMMPNLDCDFDSYFNYNEGMFSTVKGIMTTTINAMGMKMEVKSNLVMKKL